MSIKVGQAFNTLSSGRKWYAYSGIVNGGLALPAFVTLIDIPSTGLKDSYIKIQPCYGQPIAMGDGDALGLLVLIDDTVIFDSQSSRQQQPTSRSDYLELFVPRQSKLTVTSINTVNNSLQDRGAAVLGWYA